MSIKFLFHIFLQRNVRNKIENHKQGLERVDLTGRVYKEWLTRLQDCLFGRYLHCRFYGICLKDKAACAGTCFVEISP